MPRSSVKCHSGKSDKTFTKAIMKLNPDWLKRSLAAYKAWGTIRTKRNAEVRHMAAVKSWQTRLANRKAEIRHMAAVKAWRTRLANAA